MKSALQRFALTLASLFFLAAAAWSQCNNPSSPGAVICTPTDGSTVVYDNEVSARFTPASGATITGFVVYDNGVVIDKGGPGDAGLNMYDGGMYNGSHDVVVKAKDSAGNVYQASSKFSVTGQGYGPCPAPSSPGVNICNPPAGGVYGVDLTVGAAATGESAITNMSFYLDGKLLTSQSSGSYIGLFVDLAKQSTPYLLTVKATDNSGHTYTANKSLNADYTYEQYSCFYTCTPGINIVTPVSGAYVANTFNLDMQIVDNPNPIKSMKAYIDDSVVATSENGNLQQEIKDAPNGTHILTVEGWDTEGIEYRIQENININVSE